MIDFDEELKKFHPSLEVENVNDVINQHDVTDMTDIMLELFRGPETSSEEKKWP